MKKAKEKWIHDIIMTPKGHRVIKGHCDLLYDIRGQYDYLLSDWPSLWPQRSQGRERSPWPTLWPQKVTVSLEAAVTYFVTPKVTVTFVVGLT